MGTTIHAHIEVKRANKWLHYGAPNVPQDYLLFAAINGERRDDFRESMRVRITPQASIQGLPNDLSEITAFCYEQDRKSCRLHGEGALTAEDLKHLQTHLRTINDNMHKRYDLEEDVFYHYINGNCIASHQGWDDVRIVFWYDN